MINMRAYVEEQLALILGTTARITDEQVSQFWQAFSREEERESVKDQHDNFPAKASCLAQEGMLEDPPLHKALYALQEASRDTASRWPSGYRFAACLTHDVDRIVQWPWRERCRQLLTVADAVPARQRMRWAGGAVLFATRAFVGQSNIAPYDFWLEEEGRHGFHSTFFVLPEHLIVPTYFDHHYRYRDPIQLQGRQMTFAEGTRRIHAQGWSVGVHGSYASAYDEIILQQEKTQVEHMLGEPVHAIRQHFLRFDPQSTPLLQARVGMQVDSTLGYSSTIGCRAGLAFPYFWPSEIDLLEVPLIIQDVALLRDSGASSLEDAVARANRLIERVAQLGGVVTLSWHTHPESPGAFDAYRALLTTIAHLGGWGCSVDELNRWWRSRRAVVRRKYSIHDVRGNQEKITYDVNEGSVQTL